MGEVTDVDTLRTSFGNASSVELDEFILIRLVAWSEVSHVRMRG